MTDVRPPALPVIAGFAALLAEAGVRYVHWKSNDNIALSLSGGTDLDILVHPADLPSMRRVLAACQFIEGRSSRDNWYKGMSHYYRPDVESGRMVHVHLHDRLTLGFDYDKNYTLPVVDWYLEGAVDRVGLPMPLPARELVVFLIRILIKHALATRIARLPFGWRRVLRDMGCELNTAESRELKHLTSQVSVHELADAVSSSGLPLSAEWVQRAVAVCQAAPTARTIQRLARELKIALRPFLGRNEVQSFVVASGRLWRRRVRGAAARLGVPRPRKRSFGMGGRLITFVGGDGSGKSTNVGALGKTLSQTFDVQTLHIGRPGRSGSGLILALAAKIASVLRAGRLATDVRHLALARDRIAEFQRAEAVRERGGAAILDRVPLQVLSQMDAPRIVDAVSPLAQRLARWERKIYAQFSGVDLLVVLKVDPKIAAVRRFDADQAVLAKRSGEVWATEWTSAFTATFDTGTQDAQAVREAVLEQAWGSLSSPFLRTEIIGPSGVGKSTVIKGLINEISNVRRSLPFYEHPVTLVVAGVEQALTHVPRTRLEVQIWKNLTQLRWFVRHHESLSSPFGRSAHHFILDQGPAFGLAMGMVEGLIEHGSPFYWKAIGAIKVWQTGLVELQVSPEVLRQRLGARSGRPTRSMTLEGQDLDLFESRYDRAFHLLRTDLGGIAPVDTDAPKEVVVREVLDQLRTPVANEERPA